MGSTEVTYCIRLRNGLYVRKVPKDFTDTPHEAQQFPSRWLALRELGHMGSFAGFSEIVVYAPKTPSDALRGI
jgi:hypothetical protein